jgi:uncharacterized RDD family membrane protein YckC
MSCPICGELCRCAEPRSYISRAIKLAELDEYDPSEEQFASSLAGRFADDDEQELASGSLASAQQRNARQLPDVAIEVAPPDLLLTSHLDPDESWRQEVSSRIQSYKAKRRRALGNESLSFNFESTAGNHVFLKSDREPELEPLAYEQPEPLATYYAHPYATARAIEDYPEPETMDETMPEEYVDTAIEEPAPPPPPAPETAKLILFPKPPMMQEAPVDQLAEPVFDTPRILEAPDASEAITVPLADITLQPENEDTCVPYIEPVLDLPVPVAPVSQRLFAEAIDILLVVLGTVTFATVAFRMGADSLSTDTRLLAGLLVLIPAAFWSIYKYMFLLHGGVTLGMQMARLRLVDFHGCAPSPVVRRYRALAMVVSAFPLGLGLLWSFVDTETLCWHDRISKTYVTGR